MAKLKIDRDLLQKAKEISEIAGYSSVEEFVTHLIETEIARYAASATDERVVERLRGLGYIE